ncbi:hypothetical protein D3C86_2265880 [compost metagenome]
MAQVQVRGGGVETGLDAQRAAAFQPLAQLLDLEDFIGATADLGKGLFNRGHVQLPAMPYLHE